MSNVSLTERKDIQPKSKIVIKKKQKVPKEPDEPPKAKEPVIELPNIRHSTDESRGPVVSSCIQS